MSLFFFSGPWEKLNQNKLFKVPTKQWFFCLLLSGEQTKLALLNTAKALTWGLLSRHQEPLTAVHSFLIHPHLALLCANYYGICVLEAMLDNYA